MVAAFAAKQMVAMQRQEIGATHIIWGQASSERVVEVLEVVIVQLERALTRRWSGPAAPTAQRRD
jgi:hypothetical protein